MVTVAETTSEDSRQTRYFIIGSTRSGTTVVHLAVAGHPNVVALNDEMKIAPFFTEGISTFTYGNDLPEEKQRGYFALFDALTSLTPNENIKARGIKLACNSHYLASNFLNIMQNNLKDFKIIIMRRRDIVALYGSAQQGKKSGVMHSWYKGASSKNIKKLKINKWYFIAYYVQLKKLYCTLDKLKNTHDVLEVNYEGLLKSPSEEYSEIFSFLNLSAVEPTWLKSKKVLPPPTEYIVNYDEMTRLVDSLEKGEVSESVIWFSRLLNHLTWRLSTLIPRKKKGKSNFL